MNPISICPKFSIENEMDGDLSSKGWSHRIYKLSAEPVRFEKATLELSENLFIEEKVLLEGSVRMDGFIGNHRLSIAVIESDEYKLLGHSADGRLLSISFNGSHWDGVGNAPARAVSLQANAEVTDRILPDKGAKTLQEKLNRDGRREALILPMSQESEALLKALTRCLSIARNGGSKESFPEEFDWAHEDIIEIAAVLMDKVIDLDGAFLSRGEKIKREIAFAIENILWENPEEVCEEVCLDYLSSRFRYSRRQIQLAILENFGMGFVAFKRLIRIHQVDEQLKNRTSKIRIEDIARNYEFMNHGRFSGYYKEMFGVEPIKVAKNSNKTHKY